MRIVYSSLRILSSLPPFLFPGAPERWWRGSGYSSSRWPKIAPAEPATAVTSPRAPGGCDPEQSRKQAFDVTSLCSIILPWRKAHNHFWILLIFTSRSFQEFGCAVSHDMAVLKLVDQVTAYGFLNSCLQNYQFIWRPLGWNWGICTRLHVIFNECTKYIMWCSIYVCSWNCMMYVQHIQKIMTAHTSVFYMLTPVSAVTHFAYTTS